VCTHTQGIGENLSEAFSIQNDLKQEDALFPLLFNFVIECAIRNVQENQEGMKMNGTRKLVVYLTMLIYWLET
jgi:hypothetical protein